MRFEVGEIAIIAPGLDLWPEHPHSWEEVEIVRVGPFDGTQRVTGPLRKGVSWLSEAPSDYEIRCPRGWHWFALESDLRKRRPPIPDEVLRVFDGQPVSEPA